MLIVRHADAVVVWAPAKVNLYLEILGKRADGYHEVATALVAITLYDTLQFTEDRSGEIGLECDQPGLPTGAENLVYRAALLLRRRSGMSLGARIRLWKRIPVAGGLAGGSADAAATLAALDRLWRLRLSEAELMELGAQLGSDVPFFFSTGAAWCTGRGEIVRSVSLAAPLWFVLLCPPFGLATADVYKAATIGTETQDDRLVLAALTAGSVDELAPRMRNRLQPAAEKLCPRLADFQARLASLGPAAAMLSGSGTTLFALCRNRAEAERIALRLRTGSWEGRDPRVYLVRSCC